MAIDHRGVGAREDPHGLAEFYLIGILGRDEGFNFQVGGGGVAILL